MNKNLLDFIKNLSKSDKKTLSQKALKTCEEVGELAKAVLPFENAYATTHRFVDKSKILEEIADVRLCIDSIAYELGFNEDDIEEMVDYKSKKWAELQCRENNAKYPIPYEIHITVRTNNIENFKKACLSIGVKPIVLELQNQSGGMVMQDVMTSSVIVGDNKTSFNEMNRIADALLENDFEIVRKKIETVPWHPAAPSTRHIDPIMPKNCYFEAHIGVICSDTIRENLKQIVVNNDAHLSKNVFKKIDEENYKIMVTKRSYTGSIEDFNNNLVVLKDDLINGGFVLDKIITEFSVYDTKIGHDSSWISK